MLALTSADLFRATWPEHTAKRAAQAARGPVATAKAWVAARFTPSADTLLRMAAENIELRAELIRRLEAYGYADTNMASGAGNPTAPLRDAVRDMGGPAVCAAADQADAPWVTAAGHGVQRGGVGK